MERRDALKVIAGSLIATPTIAPAFASGAPSNLYEDGTSSSSPIRAGWVNRQEAREAFVAKHRHPFLSQLNADIAGTGEGKKVFLWKIFEKLTGEPLKTHHQTIGDCVGHGFGLGIDVLTAVRILMFNKQEHWLTKTATEVIYAGSRIEAGGGQLIGDGSTGVWAAEFIRNWGVLLREPYLNGKYDFTTYSGQKARELGKRGAGVPDPLEPLCKLHPVKTCSVVRSWEECRDAVANGYPVVQCSNIGFTKRRDRYGFLRRTRRPWHHAMAILGIDDESHRGGALVQNSWGENWVSGPTRHGQPVGSFWVDAKTIDAAMRQGDSIAMSGYVGYPRLDVPDYILW